MESTFDVYLLYESDLVTNIQVLDFQIHKKKGFERNLIQLLMDRGLEFVKIAESSYVIVRSRKKGVLFGNIKEKNTFPLSGATIQVQGKNRGVISNLDGQYQLMLPPGKHQLKVSFVGFQPILKEVDIPAGDSIQADFFLSNCTTLEEAVIVGSRFDPQFPARKYLFCLYLESG